MHTASIATRRSFISIFFSLLLLPLQVHAAPPKVLVTLKPLHSLVSSLLLDISEPELLLDNLQSPHDYTMKPSDRRRLSQADIIIYTGPNIESFMPSIEHSLSHQVIIDLNNTPELKLLKARALESHEHNDEHQGHGNHMDGHIWLSIDNAIRIAQYLSTEFIKQDANNADKYRSNSQQLIQKLGQLKQQIQQQMLTISHQPFVMFHDAFQYFEDEFKLTSGLFITTSPDHKVGIRHIQNLKQQMRQQKVHCVFYEPPHIPKIVQTITEDLNTRLIPLEPLGIKFQPGDAQYFNLLSDIANNLYNCMKQDL